MTKMIFVNLPVTDLGEATRFYEAIGCVKNEQFSNDDAACMVWSETITFQLLARDYFTTYAPRPISDAHQATEMLLCLSRDSKAEVDAIAEAATGAGGRSDLRDPTDLGFLYNRAFQDLDGHVFEAVWMDMNAAMSAEPEEQIA